MTCSKCITKIEGKPAYAMRDYTLCPKCASLLKLKMSDEEIDAEIAYTEEVEQKVIIKETPAVKKPVKAIKQDIKPEPIKVQAQNIDEEKPNFIIMTAKQIVDWIFKKKGIEIKASLKSKATIVKYANQAIGVNS